MRPAWATVSSRITWAKRKILSQLKKKKKGLENLAQLRVFTALALQRSQVWPPAACNQLELQFQRTGALCWTRRAPAATCTYTLKKK